MAGERGFAFVGLQNGGDCFAGNYYAKYGKVSDDQCSQYCIQDGQQTMNCGGVFRNAIYSVEK